MHNDFITQVFMTMGFISFLLVAIDFVTDSRYKFIERCTLIAIGGYGVSLVTVLIATAR